MLGSSMKRPISGTMQRAGQHRFLTEQHSQTPESQHVSAWSTATLVFLSAVCGFQQKLLQTTQQWIEIAERVQPLHKQGIVISSSRPHNSRLNLTETPILHTVTVTYICNTWLNNNLHARPIKAIPLPQIPQMPCSSTLTGPVGADVF